MNNLELECLTFVEDILKNRPKDNSGETVKYGPEDRKKILEILAEQKENIEKSRDKISEDCFCLLREIINGLMEILGEQLV